MIPEVSIIIPVYNSEKYLKTTIENILKQTFKNYELLLIDDGSTDSSGEICDNYSKLDNRIKVIHKKNGGICDARNIGLKEALGQYILFMDNDDEVNERLIEDNYALMQENDLDLIKFGREAIYINNDIIERSNIRKFKREILTKEDLTQRKLQLWYDNFFVCVWDAMYNKRILENIMFDVNFKKGGEDIAFNIDIFNRLQKIMLNDKIYYKHLIRNQFSTSTKYNPNYLQDNENKFNRFNNLTKTDIENIDLYNCIIVRDFLNSIVLNIIRSEYKIDKQDSIKILDVRKGALLKNNNILKMFKISKKYTVMYLLYRCNLYSIIFYIFKKKYRSNN